MGKDPVKRRDYNKKPKCEIPGCHRYASLKIINAMPVPYCMECYDSLNNMELSPLEIENLRKELHRVNVNNDSFIDRLMKEIPGAVVPLFNRFKRKQEQSEGLCPEESEE